MDVYLYQAALLCGDCGRAVCHKLGDKPGMRCPVCARALLSVGPQCAACGFDPEDERTYDSDDYPKGPYPDGGGESDTPQHCDDCSLFLENPLTSEGVRYVQEAIGEWVACGRHPDSPVPEWAAWYKLELEDA